ncbi:MAG: glycosyltransferase [Prochlorococcaceae cyanobacterium]
MRICLISPGHLTSNPRLVKEADALAQAGHQVALISGWSFPPHQAEDQRFESRLWAQQRRVPFGALASQPTKLWQKLRQRLARLLFRLRVHSPAVAIRAWHPAGPDLIRAARGVPADLYIAHYPAALPAAAMAARDHHGRYAFDAEDFHLGEFPKDRAYEQLRQVLRLIERRYLPGCTYTTAASSGIAQAYAETYGIPLPAVVRNVFPLSHAPAATTPRGTTKPSPSVYWFSQTIGPDRGLECAIRAIALAKSKPQLYLRGFISADFRRVLESLAYSEGVADRLHLLPPAPPDQMERLAATYDVGLVAETGITHNRRIALTNKLFTYALAGVPAVISDIPAHQEYAQEAREAVRMFQPEDSLSMARAIDSILIDQDSLCVARATAFELGKKKLNWDYEQQILLRVVASSWYQD